jgi:phosphatidylserine decarboxylase
LAITKFGIGLVIGSWTVFLIFLFLSFMVKQPVIITIAIITGMFSLFNMLFFRDPERQIPQDPHNILSPADGKIVLITEVAENEFFETEVARISIFLSIFDVHVNRSPISGKVEYFRYHRGSFMPAFREDASNENEQAAIGIIDDEGRKLMFTQIAGIIARRIVCVLREGYETKAGDRMGMIRYGSRVDVYYMKDKVDLRVKVGDRVKGGSSIIGVFK